MSNRTIGVCVAINHTGVAVFEGNELKHTSLILPSCDDIAKNIVEQVRTFTYEYDVTTEDRVVVCPFIMTDDVYVYFLMGAFLTTTFNTCVVDALENNNSSVTFCAQHVAKEYIQQRKQAETLDCDPFVDDSVLD